MPPPDFYIGTDWAETQLRFREEGDRERAAGATTDAAANQLRVLVVQLPQHDSRRAAALEALEGYRDTKAHNPAVLAYAALILKLSAIFAPPPAKPAPAGAGGKGAGPQPVGPAAARKPAADGGAAIAAGARRLSLAESAELQTRLNGSRGRLVAAYLPTAKP